MKSSNPTEENDIELQFTEEKVKALKEKYSIEMKDAEDNPIKLIMSLIFNASIVKNDPVKKDKISLELSECLIGQDGLINLFLAIVDFDPSSQIKSTLNQRYIAVANLITCMPKLCVPYPQYCDNISKQLRALVIHPVNKYSTLASIIVTALIESPHAKAQSKNEKPVAVTILDHFLDPFTNNRTDQKNRLSLSNAIIAVHNLIQNHVQIEFFVPLFPNFVCCLMTLNDAPSLLRVNLRKIVTSILNGLEPGPACCLLEQTIFYDAKKCNIYKMVAESNTISIELTDQMDLDLNIVDKTILNVLENCDNDILLLEFFFHFQAKMWTFKDKTDAIRCAELIVPFLTQTNDKIDLLDSVLTNVYRSLELVHKALLNYIEYFQIYQDHDKSVGSQNCAWSALDNCINIVQVLSTIVDKKEKNLLFGKIKPALEELYVVLNKTCLLESQEDEIKKLKKSIKSLVDELTNICSDKLIDTDSDSESYKNHREHSLILKELNSDIVPIRVHALVRLKQLLMVNDKLTVQDIPRYFSLVEHTLADQEPYVFLSSINLIAEMSVRRTDDVLPKLIDLYLQESLDFQQRINVGEVLVRLTKRMNETTPHYAGRIMNALLKGATHDEELIRMSSLTNIGVMCGSLGNSLGKYILDILFCVERALNVDTIQVKCAAIDLLRTTLMGVDKFSAEAIQRELKSIYCLLKALKYKTLDEKLCLQVDLTLDEIDRLAKEMLGFSPDHNERLIKNIKVLSLLDSPPK